MPLVVVCGLTTVVDWLHCATFLINLCHFILHIVFRAASRARLRRKPWRMLFIEACRFKRQLRKDRVLLSTASFIVLSCKCASFLDLCVCIFGVIFFLLSQKLILFRHASEPIYRPRDIPLPAWVRVNSVEQMPRCSISRVREGHLCLPVEMRTVGFAVDRSCMSVLGLRTWDGICAAFLGCVLPHSALGNFIWMWLQCLGFWEA